MELLLEWVKGNLTATAVIQMITAFTIYKTVRALGPRVDSLESRQTTSETRLDSHETRLVRLERAQ